ncbi:hypothetical protein B0H11DRAFT_1308690 [Mycena galericulata]|nr:hypothetical protein B0H11DRAFT_1308690 [Mycena galericulata]
MRVRVIYASSLFLVSALALPQTIYDVTLSVPPLTGAPAASNAVSLQESISVTAEGIGPDGWTTYVEVAAMTEIIIDAPTVTLEYTIFVRVRNPRRGSLRTPGNRWGSGCPDVYIRCRCKCRLCRKPAWVHCRGSSVHRQPSAAIYAHGGDTRTIHHCPRTQ